MEKNLSYEDLENMEEEIPENVTELFLKELVIEHLKVYIENVDYKVTQEKLNKAVDNLLNNDQLWGDIEYHVSNEL